MKSLHKREVVIVRVMRRQKHGYDVHNILMEAAGHPADCWGIAGAGKAFIIAWSSSTYTSWTGEVAACMCVKHLWILCWLVIYWCVFRAVWKCGFGSEVVVNVTQVRSWRGKQESWLFGATAMHSFLNAFRRNDLHYARRFICQFPFFYSEE